MQNSKILEEFKGIWPTPQQEIFKVGPEVISDFVAKVLIVMGGNPTDIRNVIITHDKKRLRVIAQVEKDSQIFCQPEETRGHLALMGAANEEVALTNTAKSRLRDLGYFYYDEENEKGEVYMVNVTEYKKYNEIEFNEEVTMAIITNSDFSDPYFAVDAVEEIVSSKKARKKYKNKKFKGKKRTIVMTYVERSFQHNVGFDPQQVIEWATGVEVDDDDDDEE